MRLALLVPLAASAALLHAQAPITPPLPPAITRDLSARVAAVTPKVVAWRRDLHAHPELSGFEQRTAGVVAAQLTALGLEVKTNVGGAYGVVAVLRGGRPGPAVALRADMDALPVTEQTGLPFASTVTTQFNGQTVGVMHACGHDAHTAILMGVADVLSGMKAQLSGTVTFLFQPNEEGDGGAQRMLDAGAFEAPRVEAVYGLHTWPGPTGTIATRSGGMMASIDGWRDDKFPRNIKYKVCGLKLMENLIQDGVALGYLPDYFVESAGLIPLKITGCPYSCHQTVRVISKDPEALGWLNKLWDRF